MSYISGLLKTLFFCNWSKQPFLSSVPSRQERHVTLRKIHFLLSFPGRNEDIVLYKLSVSNIPEVSVSVCLGLTIFFLYRKHRKRLSEYSLYGDKVDYASKTVATKALFLPPFLFLTHTHTLARTHAHTRTHARTCTHTHTLARTHTHTHLQACTLFFISFWKFLVFFRMLFDN